ncbi:MAG: RsmE family RNA methyltransferase, partial [Rhodoferax sp.]
TVHPLLTLSQWLKALPAATHDQQRLLLSLRKGGGPLHAIPLQQEAVFLSGPEGGLGAAEEDLAIAHGFVPVSLGQRILRAETAALAALTTLALLP